MTIYKLINVNEELPTKEGYYHGYTNSEINADIFWFTTINNENKNTFNHGVFRHLCCTHWLQPIEVEIPADEEIELIAIKEIEDNSDGGCGFFEQGATWLRDKILKQLNQK